MKVNLDAEILKEQIKDTEQLQELFDRRIRLLQDLQHIEAQIVETHARIIEQPELQVKSRVYKKARKNTLRSRVEDFLCDHPKDIISRDYLVEKCSLENSQAASMIHLLSRKGILKRVRRGEYRWMNGGL